MGKFQRGTKGVSELNNQAAVIGRLTQAGDSEEIGLDLAFEETLEKSPGGTPAATPASSKDVTEEQGKSPGKRGRKRKAEAAKQKKAGKVRRTLDFQEDLYVRAMATKGNSLSLIRSFDEMVNVGLAMVLDHLEDEIRAREKSTRENPLHRHLGITKSRKVKTVVADETTDEK